MLDTVKALKIGEKIEIAGIEFSRVSDGFLVDLELVAEDDVDEHFDLLFHYEAMDCGE